MRAEDTYPDTERTWIVRQLHDGDAGRAAVRNRMMELYLEPLRATLRSRLMLGPAAALDAVQGFFTSRLSRPDYFLAWEASGKRLRHWLWNGLCFYLHEAGRAERRLPTLAELPDRIDETAADPGQEFERNFAIALVRAALGRAERACAADGFADHWRVFERRQVCGEPLAGVARDLGVTVARASVMLRAPRRRVVEALAELLVADGVPAAEVPRAIGELLAAKDG